MSDPAFTSAVRILTERAPPSLRRRISRLAEPQILFPALAVFSLLLIWSATWNLIRVQRKAAEDAAAAATVELTNTYEAQVVRALREIDQSLNVVRYASEHKSPREALAELKARNLLPADLIFIVSVIDSRGAIVASTRPDQALSPSTDFRKALSSSDTLVVAQPIRHDDTWSLQFGRALAGGGAVIISADADYFVSGYDANKLGAHGVLGLLGTDGMFRVRRSGDVVKAGDTVNYTKLVPDMVQDTPLVSLGVSPVDGVRRYGAARQLYEFPLAIFVGLSHDEQLAPQQQSKRTFELRALLGSIVVVVICTLLGRMSLQLARARRRESAARVAHAERVEYLAFHDSLTGLPNRSLFNKLLGLGIAHAHRDGRRLAVAFLDLDRFKQINDTLGHEAGDQLLKEVATRLKACLRETDVVARLGGDEFVLLLSDLSEEHYVATVAQKVTAAIARPFTLIGQEFRVTGSMGISVYPKDGLDEQTLTKNADVAMYKAKEEGKNNFQFYAPELNANTLERLALEASLRHALENQEFELYYQAKRDIHTGRITGMESLLRWQHPDLGPITPARFIPMAEDTGLIIPIGRWVLETACRQNMAWQQQGLPRLSIAVNLSTRQFRDDGLLRDIQNILAATGMDPRLLELEIHESLLVHDVEHTLLKLTGLKAMGVRIAIDDFGTGYSSLISLQRFPLDTIKIDRNFIRDVTAHPEEENLTDAIIAIGRNLSVTVVAQGVETREQADFLREHACDELQGFYFNEPLAAEQFGSLLRSQRAEIIEFGSDGRRAGRS